MAFLDNNGLAYLWHKVLMQINASSLPIPSFNDMVFTSIEDLESVWDYRGKTIAYMENCLFKIPSDPLGAILITSDFVSVNLPNILGRAGDDLDYFVLRRSMSLDTLNISYSADTHERPFTNITLSPIRADQIYYGPGEADDGNLVPWQSVGSKIFSMEQMLLPPGGTSGQVLTKKSNTDYDTQWSDPAGGGNSSGEIYSTDEIRIGTWIDGKPLYQKTFTGTVSSDGNFPALGIARVQTWVNGAGWIVRNDKYQYPIPAFYSPQDYIGFAAKPDGTTLFFNYGTALSTVIKNAPFHITFQYTKTTDQATVLSENPQFIPTAAVTSAPVELQNKEV